MPARAAAKKPAAAAAASKPKAFDFKKMAKDKKSSSSAAGSSSSSARAHDKKPTTAFCRRTKVQSGDRAGEETNNWVYVFNPAFGKNDAAKAAVEEHILGADEIKSFKKDLGGFPVRVYNPKQANAMHAALQQLDSKMSSAPLQLDGLEAPLVTVVTIENVDLPETKWSEAQEGVTVLMLEGFTYPLYKKLRGLDYDFVRGVHNRDGVNRWCRVVEASEAAGAEKETAELLRENGWDVDTAAGDAADWPEDDEEED